MKEVERPLEPEYGKNCYHVKTEKHEEITYVVYADTEEEAIRTIEEGHWDDIAESDEPVIDIMDVIEVL